MPTPARVLTMMSLESALRVSSMASPVASNSAYNAVECVEIGEILGQRGHLEIFRKAFGVRLQSTHGLVAKIAGLVAHLEELFALGRRQADGAVFENKANRFQSGVKGLDFFSVNFRLAKSWDMMTLFVKLRS